MTYRVVLAAVVTFVLVMPTLARAQSAAVDTPLQLEAKRKRLIVRPEPPVAAAVRDAERAATNAADAELTRKTNDPVRRTPQLDYDVTNAIQGRSVSRGVVSRGGQGR
jgi:hypothetical protein